MTTRIALIGNSHLGCVKEAYTATPERWPGLDPVFFGVPTPFYSKMRVTADLVFCLPAGRKPLEETNAAKALTAINGVDRLDISDCACAALLGKRSLFNDLPDIFEAWSIEDLREVPGRRIMSRSLWSATVDGLALGVTPDQSWTHFLGSGRRLFRSYQPSPVASIAEDPEVIRKMPSIVELRDPRGFGAAQRAFEDRAEAVLARMGVEFVRQPAATRDDNGFTLARYAEGSRRLRDREVHPGGDSRHMNAEYGASYLDALVAKLAPGAGAATQ
jgi:hypothetical protein